MNPLVKLAANAQAGQKKFVLFVGAGVSKDAGLPTSWDLMIKIASLIYAAETPTDKLDPAIDLEKWFLSSKYAIESFPTLIGSLYPKPPDQQSFLKEYFQHAAVGEAHKGIAELVRRGIVRTIITTNFDHCLEEAIEQAGIAVQVISSDDVLESAEPLIHCKEFRIYKPHGNLGAGKLRNPPRDLEELSPSMEDELLRILNDHGVIVLGYSGRDKAIQELFRKRRHNLYQIFWIDPAKPEGEIEGILQPTDYVYVECKGANQVIQDLFRVIDNLVAIAPTGMTWPMLHELKLAVQTNHPMLESQYHDFLDGIFDRLKASRPDFTKYENYDEAIVEQIEKCVDISCDFIEASLQASRKGDDVLYLTIYKFFEKAMALYCPPKDRLGTYRETDFDGFRFLVYEMFVSFIAAILKYDHLGSINSLISADLFVEDEYESKYVPYTKISRYNATLDGIRNDRLAIGTSRKRISIAADTIRKHFTDGRMAMFIRHQEIMEADYLLYIISVGRFGVSPPSHIWRPQCCVFLRKPPGYILKAESKRALTKLSHAAGIENQENLIQVLQIGDGHFSKLWSFEADVDSPLEDFEYEKLGSRE